MTQKLEGLTNDIAGLSLLQTAELIKMLEEKLGVSASAMMPQLSVVAEAASEEEEKTEFDVILVSGGSDKLKVIKEVRTITGLPLKESKEAAEGSNVVLKTGISKSDAEAIKKQLEAVGATVKLS